MSTLLTLIICRISDRKHPPCRVLMLQQFAKKCSVLKREKKQMEKEQLCTSLSFVFIISPVSTSDFPKTRGGEPESHGIPDLVGSLEVICPSPTGYRNPSQGAAEISEADTQLCWETVLHGSLMFCISRKQRYPFFFFSFFCYTMQQAELPAPGIEPTPSALETRSLSHWTTREVPRHQLSFQRCL